MSAPTLVEFIELLRCTWRTGVTPHRFVSLHLPINVQRPPYTQNGRGSFPFVICNQHTKLHVLITAYSIIESLDPLCYCACNHVCSCCGPILDLVWLYNAECWEWAGYKAVRQELAKRIMQTSQSTRSRHDGRVSIMFSSLWLTICSAVLWDSGVCCRFLQGNILCISCSIISTVSDCLPCLGMPAQHHRAIFTHSFRFAL